MTQEDFKAFRDIGDQSEDIYFIFDLDSSKFIYVNAAFDLIWKVSSKDLLKDTSLIWRTIHGEDRQYVLDGYERFLKQQSRITLNFRILWPSNEDRWLRCKAYPIGQNGQGYVAGIVEDDSDRVKLIFNMQKVNARKDSALEILSHDLRGPIGIVQSLAGLITDNAESVDSKKILEWSAMIHDICKRNIDLIQDLVNQEFLESAELDICKERLDLVWEINEVIHNYKKSQLNIAKEFQLTSSHDKIYAPVDSMKFMQIMNNLISNAIKFTPDGGVIHIDIKQQEDSVLIMVSDNGIGIPKPLQPALFQKFSRARRTGLKGEESVGLGMSIIKWMVELHHGKIWFESAEDEGTKFFIELPVEENGE